MATLISGNGDGNFATAATWKNVCTGTGALQTTISNTVNTGVNYTTIGWSATFTVTNTEVIEGFAMYIKRQGTTGTLTVALSDDNGVTATREVTVNASDVPDQYSWVFFKFGSTLTADGGSDYRVSIKNSTGGSGASIYRSSTAADWCRILREDSAPGSLSASDVFYIMDDLTGAGAKTTNTITMNNTATTDWGAITVGLGTLTFGTSASTNYYLKTSGDLNVWGGGILNIGTTGTPMPSTSTAVLEIDPTSDGEFGLKINDGATLSVQGASMTRVWDLLATDEAVNSTSWTTANSTGWKDNDQIAIASTTRTPGETELGALNGDASGTTLTVDGFGGTGGGLAYAHSGTTGTQAEIINLTRNVKIRSATSTLMTYVYIAATATVDIDYGEFYYLGENATGKRGIEIATTTGNCSIQYSSVHDTEDWGLYLVSASGSNIAIDNNVFYNLNTAKATNLRGVLVTATSGTTSIQNNVFLGLQSANSAHSIYFADNGLTFSGNRMAGFTEGTGSCAVIYAEAGTLGTCDDNITHSHDGYGWGYSASVIPGGAACDNLYMWFTAGTYGLYSTQSSYEEIVISNSTFVGAGTTASILGYGRLTLNNCIMDSHATHTSNYAVFLSNISTVIRLNNCTLGGTTAFAAGGISAGVQGKAYLYNTTIADSTEVAGMSGTTTESFIRSHKHDTSGTTYKNWFKTGTIDSDQTTRHTASGYSWKLTPSSATLKLVFPGPSIFDTYKVAVNASAAVTITAYVYKDSSYNGNAPRLVLVGGYIGGIANDVTDSLTVAAENWEQLSVSGTPNEAGVVEFYLDADGTAGSVYIDDIEISQA